VNGSKIQILNMVFQSSIYRSEQVVSDDKTNKTLLTSTSSSSLSSSSSTISTLNPTLVKLPKSTSSKKQITFQELKNHTTKNDAWIAIHGKVYNITKFATVHPGGDLIYQYSGRNATDEFDAFHLPRVQNRLPAFYVGELQVNMEDTSDSANTSKNVDPVSQYVELDITKEYRSLKLKLWKDGWFESNESYYIMKDMVAISILATGIYAVLNGNNVLQRTLIGGAFVGLALQQIAFVAHDAGHWGISHPKTGGGINWLGWIHGSILFGVSIEMWVDEHSAHHAMTMRPHADPQFKYLPLFLISNKELDDFHTKLSYVEQVLAKWLVPVQHYTMIPISVIIGRFNLHVISFIYAIQANAMYDVFGLCLHFAWFGTIVSYLPSIKEQIMFVLISYSIAGILHIQLTISHLATDTFTAEEDEREQFFAFQCKTTRNINSYWWNEWFHGGLQYQIEHHLFPQMPRHNLKKVKPLVEELCKKHSIPYRSTGFFSAILECLSDFRRLSSFLGDLVHPHEIMSELGQGKQAKKRTKQ